jgi:hypothetical protein
MFRRLATGLTTAPQPDFAPSFQDLPGWEAAVPLPPEMHQGSDPLDQLESADRADQALLRMVGCAACATMLLALAASIGL